MFQTLERLAATDTKHGDRLRLESYAYFVTAISEAGQAVPVLQWHVRQAAAAKRRAMQAYVQQQLEHGKFWKLMELSMVCVCAPLHRLILSVALIHAVLNIQCVISCSLLRLGDLTLCKTQVSMSALQLHADNSCIKSV